VTMVDLRALSAGTGGSAELTGYFVRPQTPGPWPAVVVIHEAFGLDGVNRRHTERIAGMGYLALAPDLFSDGGPKRCLAATLTALRSGQGKAYADIEAARQWLLVQDGATGKVGIIGFCMGGGFALMSVHNGFDVAAPNYGRLPAELDEAVADACPVVASYGGRAFLPQRCPQRPAVDAADDAGEGGRPGTGLGSRRLAADRDLLRQPTALNPVIRPGRIATHRLLSG
jgi:carboxymethylenebutenolidase